MPKRRRDTPARRDSQEPRGLLDRILDTPHLAHVIPRLPPEILHRVIQHCGLEACGELVALAMPGQLARVFDLDLWSPARPGLDDQFDADRFGLWLEVMTESGAASAAQALAGVDVALATAAFAQHVKVFDPATVSPRESADGDEMPDVGTPHDRPSCDVGGYLVVGTRADSWDAVVAVLGALDAQHQNYFHRLMRGCRSQSNSGRELDGLDDLLSDNEQALFDVAFTRERRREQQGYMTPAQARAFLQMSRDVRHASGSTPSANPIARAYFQGLEWTTEAETVDASRRLPTGEDAPSVAEDSAEAVTAIVDMLRDAGILPGQPRALLDGPEGPAPRLARIQALMQFADDRDPIAFSTRGQELAFLANTIAAGCSIQSRPFTPQEASDAAVATCNLGLENWPGAALANDFLVDHDLVSVFQIGWTVLHEQVCMDAAKQLITALRGLRCDDRETQAGLNALRIELTRQSRAKAPWRAKDALEVIAILDMPAWVTLLGLIDECPVMHAGIGVSQGSRAHQISATAFGFISENSQIASIHAFLRSLPDTLRG